MSIFALCFASRFQVKPWIFRKARPNTSCSTLTITSLRRIFRNGFLLIFVKPPITKSSHFSAISVAIDSNGVDCNFDPYTYNYYERYYDDYSWFRVGCKCIKAAQVFASISAYFPYCTRTNLLRLD